MRADSASFAAYNEAAAKSPRFVIAHLFDVESVYCTSHSDISGVPGIVIQKVVMEPSAISQRIVPDEGRSEIGSFSYSLLDLNSAVTNILRGKLQDDLSFREKQVRFYVGYEGMSFSDMQLFQTQIIKDIDYSDGAYNVACADITRALREEVFDPKKTTLRDSVDASATTIPVYTTAGFQTVFHGPSYSDAPNSTVGYIQIEDEIIRYTGTTADSFTGCTRGVLNTKAVPHSVDTAANADRRPKVQEVIYLELPAVKLAYAIMTGVLYGDSATLPTHWHCGIPTTLVRLADFTGIGPDLWDTSLDTNGFVVRFQGLTKTDAKKFLESELYQLLGCHSHTYSDGTIGLKRMNPVLADAAYVVELNESNVVETSELKHDFSGMHNRLRIDWNWNGKECTRTTLFVDAQSIAVYGEAPIKKLQFKGLHGARHTEVVIRTRMDAFRDRYSAPPQRITVTVLPSLNRLEVGDIVRLRLPNVRDYAGNGASINRSFEIQRKSENSRTGNVVLELFGSSAPASIEPPNSTGSGAALPDAAYTSVGTNLASVCTINVVGGVGVIQPGTYNLTGHVDMNNAAAVYYYNGDLELANGATLTINNNVQLRVRGFFTINGAIDGIGRGKAGQSDAAGWNVTTPGLPGFIGNSRGMDGVVVAPNASFIAFGVAKTQPAAFTRGQNESFPELELRVSGNSLLGIPSDLRGTSGGAGGKVGRANQDNFASGTVTGNGGAGAASGAGLAIISRGVAPGASASINLSGNNSAATSQVSNPWGQGGAAYPGAGGGGGPGALLILLDGSSLTLPDLGGKFVALCGTVPVSGSLMSERGPVFLQKLVQDGWTSPVAGYESEDMISGADLSNVAYGIQYIPGVETAQQDQDRLPPPITGISITGVELANIVSLTLPDVSLFDTVELYASINNDRANAIRVADEKSSLIRHQLAAGQQRWYWARTKRGTLVSDWFPSSATGGVTDTSVATFIARGNCEIAGQVARKVGGAVAWDSDVYSLEKFRDGCAVTFKPDQTNAGLMVGLNTDPAADQSYFSIDHAWYCVGDGTLEIYESGAQVGTSGSYTTSTILTIRHDGRRVQYVKDGVIVREVIVGSVAYHMDSSFLSPGAQVSRLSFAPANQVTPTPWIARGNCIAGVSTASKVGGSNAWDSDVYSVESYSTCHVVAKASQTNAGLMVGLNTDPVTNSDYATIDHAWFCVGDGGTLQIYESGGLVGSFGSYTTSTEVAITYDGANVRYYKDRVLQRTVAISNQRFYADTSFHGVGGAINSFRFGPGTSLEAVGTIGLEGNAATDVYTAQLVGPTDFTNTFGDLPVLTVDVQPKDGTWIITCSYEAETISGSGARGGAGRQVDTGSVVETVYSQEILLPVTRTAQVVRAALAALPAYVNKVGLFKIGSGSASTVRYRNVFVSAELIKR